MITLSCSITRWKMWLITICQVVNINAPYVAFAYQGYQCSDRIIHVNCILTLEKVALKFHLAEKPMRKQDTHHLRLLYQIKSSKTNTDNKMCCMLL